MRNVHSAQHISAPIICIFFTFLFLFHATKTSPDTSKTVNLLLVCGLSAQTGELLSRPHVYFREKQQAAAPRRCQCRHALTNPNQSAWSRSTGQTFRRFFSIWWPKLLFSDISHFYWHPCFSALTRLLPAFSSGSGELRVTIHSRLLPFFPPVFLASFPALSGQQLAVSEYSRLAQVSLWVRW